MPLGNLDRRVAKQDGYVSQLHALKKQRDGERVAEPVGMSALDRWLRRTEHFLNTRFQLLTVVSRSLGRPRRSSRDARSRDHSVR